MSTTTRAAAAIAARSPVALIGVGLAVTLAIIAWLLVSAVDSRRDFDALFDRRADIEEALDAIVRLDEILTTSALLTAATADAKWQQRYDSHVPELDAAIGRAMDLAPAQVRDRFDRMTKTANDNLVALETRAFELVAAGQPAAALALLQGTEYGGHKATYGAGLTEFRDALETEIATHRVAVSATQQRNLLVTLAGAALVVAGWGVVLLTLLRWRTQLVAAEEERARMAEERMATEHARLEAEARLRQDAAAEQRRLLHDLADRFEGNVQAVVEVVSESASDLNASAESLQEVSDRTQERSTAVATASEEAATNVATVASATAELTASINEIGRQVSTSRNISREAVEQARRVDEMVGSLQAAAGRIGEVVSLITDIASQTNLLALNATIEAARAGEAGKGFAVVANEVKGLANQTARATDEIATQIGTVQSATKDAVEAISGVAATIGHMDEITSAIAAAIEEQNAAMHEIARSVQQASDGVQDVSANIVGVDQASHQTGAAASAVLKAARSLSTQSERLRGDVADFIQGVRAM